MFIFVVNAYFFIYTILTKKISDVNMNRLTKKKWIYKKNNIIE